MASNERNARAGTARRLRLGTALLILAATALHGPGARSGVSSGAVLPSHVTVCFVGDAIEAQPLRVMQIMANVRQFEYAANIRLDFLGACPPARQGSDGNDYFEGDIRVVIPGTSVNAMLAVPGTGCHRTAVDNHWGSWGMFPSATDRHRSCMYTVKLGGDGKNAVPYVNHALHEFGHALGLVHEHDRNDVERALCDHKQFGGTVGRNLLTPYDRHSVMHYALCDIPGNYGYSGLSDFDRLTMHILYPEDARVAEFVGATVVRANENITLRSAWKLRGANISAAASSFQWGLGGPPIASTPDLDIRLPVGTYPVEYAYRDFLGRNYSYKGPLRVLKPEDFTKTISGPVPARALLL